MRYLITLILALFASAFVGLAQADVIKDELEMVRAVHLRATETAKKNLIDAMEVVHKKFAQRGELENVRAVQSQKELFERDGTLPTSPRLGSARSDYEKELRLALNNLRKGLERAKVDYTKALKIPEAEAVSAELDQLTKRASPPSSVTTTAPIDMLPVGSKWTGTIAVTVSPKGNRKGNFGTHNAELLVSSRSGEWFEARFEIQGSGVAHHVRTVRGRIRGNTLGWSASDVKAVAGHEGHDTRGTIQGGNMVLISQGLAKGPNNPYPGHPVAAQATLTRRSE